MRSEERVRDNLEYLIDNDKSLSLAEMNVELLLDVRGLLCQLLEKGGILGGLTPSKELVSLLAKELSGEKV